jgi:hypothetical protein
MQIPYDTAITNMIQAQVGKAENVRHLASKIINQIGHLVRIALKNASVLDDVMLAFVLNTETRLLYPIQTERMELRIAETLVGVPHREYQDERVYDG